MGGIDLWLFSEYGLQVGFCERQEMVPIQSPLVWGLHPLRQDILFTLDLALGMVKTDIIQQTSKASVAIPSPQSTTLPVRR